MWKILCAGSAGRQLKLRNTSSSILLPCAEEKARIWKLSRRREDSENSDLLQNNNNYKAHEFGKGGKLLEKSTQRRRILAQLIRQNGTIGMLVIEFSAPAEENIVSKEEEKRTKYQELLGQLRRLWPDYTVSLLVMVIGSLGGMSNTLLSALRAMPVCRAAAHILAARM
nr:unnamed protein product [Callosobruchus chinensis]